MSKVLLLCPKFMGYDEILVKEIKKKHSVIHIDTEIFLAPKRKEYKSLPLIQRAFFKVFRKQKERHCEKLLCENNSLLQKKIACLNIKDIDFVLAINGDAISNDIYHLIKDKNPKAYFLLYIWDDIDWLFKKSQIKYFDRIFSYNIEDCKEWDFEYLPVFTDCAGNVVSSEKHYDIAIIASANKKRIEYAKRIYQKYKNIYSFFIYFYSKDECYDFFTNKTPLSYSEYMRKVASSKAVFEMGRFQQRGPTTRVFDALAVKTKVITINKHIYKYPIYGDNVLIIDKNIKIPKSFVDKPYVDTNHDIWTIDRWIHHVMEETT